MAHNHMSMGSMSGMSGMSMSGGPIAVNWIPQVYWIFVGAAIAILTLVNLSNHLLFRQRLRALAKGVPDPARPRNLLSESLATATALVRESSNYSLPSLPPRFNLLGWTPPSPSLGSCILLAANTVLLLVLGFYRLDPTEYDNYQDIAYRWGYLTLGQFPLLFLLAGKESIIGFFTGHSYERLNWLHRWVARCMLLTATLHMGFWFGNWAPYDYIGYQLKNDTHFTQTGFTAWCILLWIVLSSAAPIRGLAYELFVLQHFLSFVAFITMVFIHTPSFDHAWLWVPVGLYFFDRCVRGFWLAWNNVAIFHPGRRQQNKSMLACHAELEPLPGSMTRVTIRNPPFSWRPGQHVHLSAPSIIPLQTHPFTIASLPSDGKMEFVIKSHNGGTRRLFTAAGKHPGLPTNSSSSGYRGPVIPCLVSDAYGTMRPLRQFDSVVLFAGSTGASFTMPLLRDIVRQWKTMLGGEMASRGLLQAPAGAVTRRIRLVWVVKSSQHVSWFAAALQQACSDVQQLRDQGLDVKLHASIYVTCDEKLTADWGTSGSENIAKPDIEEGKIMENYNSSSDETVTSLLEKKPPKLARQHSSQEIDPRADSSMNTSQSDDTKPKACRSDGTCCCQTTVTDEKTAPNFVCNCNHAAQQEEYHDGIDMKKPVVDNDPIRALAQHKVATISGRPHTETVIRRTLERARGESAVVVCGPQSLNNDVRRTVVKLSDERAVGRGTGALGVWFWSEGYGL